MEENKKEFASSHVMDIFFKGWSKNFDLVDEMEQRFLQAIESQKGWVQSSRDQLSKMEEDSHNLMTEWKTNAQEILDKYQEEHAGQTFSKWTEKLEEIGHKSQTLALSPGKATLEIVSNSMDQYEQAIINAIDQQQKNRVEFTNDLKSIVEQLKQAQLGLLQPFGFTVK